MSVKKKATSKKSTIKKKEKKVNKPAQTDTQDPYSTTPPAKGQPIPQAPPDPLQGIEETQAAAAEPTSKVAKGDVKPRMAKPVTFQEKKPEEMTGPEQEAMMAGGGVLPKEQAEKEKATIGPTGPVAPQPPKEQAQPK